MFDAVGRIRLCEAWVPLNDILQVASAFLSERGARLQQLEFLKAEIGLRWVWRAVAGVFLLFGEYGVGALCGVGCDLVCDVIALLTKPPQRLRKGHELTDLRTLFVISAFGIAEWCRPRITSFMRNFVSDHAMVGKGEIISDAVAGNAEPENARRDVHPVLIVINPAGVEGAVGTKRYACAVPGDDHRC